MALGGRMVITFVGRRSLDTSSAECGLFWELLAKSLEDMISKRLNWIHSTYIPYYAPHIEEVKTIIRSEGSFDLDRIEAFDVDWDTSEDYMDREYVSDKLKSGNYVAMTLRPACDMVASHFGIEEMNMDYLFSRHAHHVGETELLAKDRPKHHLLVLCMSKK
ncbi:hypothetical protein AQUCO_02800187v1 [Aquilegia coerulea]|uniref:SAM-dependent methyltransferase Erg6/SMT-type domain-containing protein n=1 Tax=Aquilegia coerulea TaxID=218851 RepID=A0A2G5D4B4_AQUCA|nr:hypothetical protein AQUCO_02800187v1 [Aquilegia coerulea]